MTLSWPEPPAKFSCSKPLTVVPPARVKLPVPKSRVAPLVSRPKPRLSVSCPAPPTITSFSTGPFGPFETTIT